MPGQRGATLASRISDGILTLKDLVGIRQPPYPTTIKRQTSITPNQRSRREGASVQTYSMNEPGKSSARKPEHGLMRGGRSAVIGLGFNPSVACLLYANRS